MNFLIIFSNPFVMDHLPIRLFAGLIFYIEKLVATQLILDWVYIFIQITLNYRQGYSFFVTSYFASKSVSFILMSQYAFIRS